MGSRTRHRQRNIHACQNLRREVKVEPGLICAQGIKGKLFTYRLGLVDFGNLEELLVDLSESVDSSFERSVFGGKSEKIVVEETKERKRQIGGTDRRAR